jgi:hypothetical protein
MAETAAQQRQQHGGSKHGSMVMVATAQRQWRRQCCALAAWQHDSSDMRLRCCKVFVVESSKYVFVEYVAHDSFLRNI